MKRIAAVILSVSMMLMATSCNLIVNNSENRFDYPVTIGNLQLDEAPQKIAVMSANLADVVIACGYEGKLTARSDEVTQEALSVLESVGTVSEPNLDAIEDLEIDLILTDTVFEEEYAEKLDKLGVKVIVMKAADDSAALGKLYNNAAAAIAGGYTGKMQAMSVFENLRSSLEAIKVNSSTDEVVATSCYIYDISGDELTVAYGSDFADQLFDYACVTNIAAGDDDGVIGIDTLLKGNPETIFCDSGVYEKLSSNKDLKSLKALTKGTVYELPKKYLELQGATCVQTTDFIAAKTHSEYEQTEQWPAEFEVKKEVYVAPFEPKKDIYYTVGESYEPIQSIEERLIGLGYMSGEADKNFTEETAAAISAFQTANSLTVTGIADYDTLKVLLSANAISKADAGEVTVNVD